MIDHPAAETTNDFDIDMNESSEGTGNHVPVPNFHSNHIKNKLVLFNEKGEVVHQPPGGLNVSSVNHCICGNPCRIDKQTCESCEGRSRLHLEGEILKKQKKGGSLKAYWFVLLGLELYCYKH